MSHYMTALAMRQTGLKPASKVVLYWLADHHNGETGMCFPSLKTLSEECEMDVATVKRHLSTLEGLGLISRDKRFRENGSQTSTQYTLTLREPLAQNAPPPSAKCAKPLAQNDTPPNLGIYNLGIEPSLDNGELPLNMDLDEPKPKPRKKARIPDGWTPNDTQIEYALSKQLTHDEIEEIASEFSAYWGDRAGRDASKSEQGWNAAWQNNVRRVASQYIRNRGMARQQSSGGYRQGGSVAAVVARRWGGGEV